MKPSLNDAMKSVISDIKQCPPERLQAKLKQHAGGPVGRVITEGQAFLEHLEAECKTCRGYHYTLVGCCSGFECGCMGQPVDAEPCKTCNSDGEKPPSEEAKKDYPFFFLSKE